jgi:response regulator RpfG family c-di-GMP phosphodiesterase
MSAKQAGSPHGAYCWCGGTQYCFWQGIGRYYRKLLEWSYSLVFLVAKMPDMDGFDVARFANKLAHHKPQVIMISGYHYANEPIICNAIEEGLITEFLSKPFTNEEILLH